MCGSEEVEETRWSVGVRPTLRLEMIDSGRVTHRVLVAKRVLLKCVVHPGTHTHTHVP